MATSLDGYYTGDEFDYAPPEEEHQYFNDLFESLEGVIFGRVIHDIFVSYWDTLDLTDAAIPQVERDYARIFRTKKRVVISHTDRPVEDSAVVITNDVVDRLRRFKEEPGGDYALVCGAELLGTLAGAGLVDEYQVVVFPKIMGGGRRLFESTDATVRLKLLETRSFSSGSVVLRYVVKGDSGTPA
jgi:dihydrofolate reductase